MQQINSIRGMNDWLAEDSESWQALLQLFQSILANYNYRQIATPIVERTALFCHSIGETSDIIGKEMYSFEDRGGENISLRPEGTAGAMRSLLQHNLLQQNSLQRLWYIGAFFRYERPQKGRLRQFHQLGVEAYGSSCSSIDAEIIALTANILDKLQIKDSCKLLINSLGTSATRAKYREQLVEYFTQYKADLDADSQNRLTTNPLRILDSKIAETQAIADNAPKLQQLFTAEESKHFEQLQQHLNDLGIAFTIDNKLVRGLDYYSHTVFEWQSDALGAQSAVLGGGRYDGLATSLGSKKPVPACGFAMGIERLILILQQLNPSALKLPNITKVFICYEQATKDKALTIAENLRSNCQKLQIIWHTGSTNLGKQFAKANKINADFAVVVGQRELENNQVVIKNLSDAEAAQQTIAENDLINYFSKAF